MIRHLCLLHLLCQLNLLLIMRLLFLLCLLCLLHLLLILMILLMLLKQQLLLNYAIALHKARSNVHSSARNCAENNAHDIRTLSYRAFVNEQNNVVCQGWGASPGSS